MKNILFVLLFLSACASQPPKDIDTKLLPKDFFVSLAEVDPSIVIEMRYAGSHNFLGRPVKGYLANKCFVTKEAADSLAKVQVELKTQSLSLKMYDCYRPQRGVDDFIAWAKMASDTKTKKEFYPKVDKKDVFKLGFVAEKSGHSRGSTVDLTIVPFPAPKQEDYKSGQKLKECYLPAGKRFKDNSIDLGTGYDCFDDRAATEHPSIEGEAKKNRILLRGVLEKHGFTNYEKEWWHFTLKQEPFPETFFDFPVE